MNADNLSDLPDWDEARFAAGEEGDEWKPKPTRIACKAMYSQWQQIMFLLKGIVIPIIEKVEDSIEAAMDIDMAKEIHGYAYIVGSKILSSEAGGMYVIRMENAAIIRKMAQDIASGLLMFELEDSADKNHIDVVRDEINKFKAMFITWVNTFEKDEFTDDWGLFL